MHETPTEDACALKVAKLDEEIGEVHDAHRLRRVLAGASRLHDGLGRGVVAE